MVRDMCAAEFFGTIVTTTSYKTTNTTNTVYNTVPGNAPDYGHLYHSNINRNSHTRKAMMRGMIHSEFTVQTTITNRSRRIYTSTTLQIPNSCRK
jgi:hypothetical protein